MFYLEKVVGLSDHISTPISHSCPSLQRRKKRQQKEGFKVHKHEISKTGFIYQVNLCGMERQKFQFVKKFKIYGDIRNSWFWQFRGPWLIVGLKIEFCIEPVQGKPPESIEWFIDDQTFSLSVDLATPPPPSPVSKSLSLLSLLVCVAVDRTNGRGEG